MLLLSSVIVLSQNLVVNGDFENYNENFVSANLLDPILIDSFPSYNWYNLNNSSPDFYHTENVLNKFTNFQKNRQDYPELFNSKNTLSGKAWVGLCLFRCDGYSEQITGKLSESLQKDSIYEVSFFLRIGEYSYFCLTSIGVSFAYNDFIFSNYVEPYYSEMNKTRISIDIEFDIQQTCSTLDWLECKGIYRARGGENSLTFGYSFPRGYCWESCISRYRKTWTKSLKHKNRFYIKEIKRNPFIGKSDNFIDINNSFEVAYYLIDNVNVVPLPSSE